MHEETLGMVEVVPGSSVACDQCMKPTRTKHATILRHHDLLNENESSTFITKRTNELR